jgi:hypothetical protein
LFEAEVGATVGNKHVVFFETAFIEQFFNPFPGGIFSFFMLGFYTVFSASQPGLFALFKQFVNFRFFSHGNRIE